MSRIAEHQTRHAVYAAIFALTVTVAAPATAESEGASAQPARELAGTPPELIQTEARQLGKDVGLINDAAYTAVWQGSETPKVGVVEGEAFRKTLDRIRWLADECDRQIAADKASGQTGTEKDATACLAGLREIRSQVFDLRTNAARVWSPTVGGSYSHAYLVDVSDLTRVSERIARLAEACGTASDRECGRNHPVTGSGSATVAPVNNSLVW